MRSRRRRSRRPRATSERRPSRRPSPKRSRAALMGWIDLELVLVSLAAMLSPTTLTFSILTLVLSPRPFRTGLWFYLGAFGATIGIGIVAAFVLGNAAASSDPSSPKTWVAVLDIVLGAALLTW